MAHGDFDDAAFTGEDDDLPEPHGARPYGAKPYGAKPYGAKPYGAKPYGAKPYGAKPYGAKPYGAKPYGAKPYGAKAGQVDLDEWSDELAELVFDHSAVLRLGPTIVAADRAEAAVAAFSPAAAYRPPGAAPVDPPDVADEGELRPRDHPLVAGIAVRDGLLRAIAGDPQLARALKLDLAHALAEEADGAFLERVRARAGGPASDDGDLLVRARKVVDAVRAGAPGFRNAAWILHPETVTALAQLRTITGLATSADAGARALVTFPGLLELDGEGGGTLLGFPFVTSRAAADEEDGRRLFFAADWEEAWIAVDGDPVSVEISPERVVRQGAAVSGLTVIRASMWHDFTLRRAEGFAWARG